MVFERWGARVSQKSAITRIGDEFGAVTDGPDVDDCNTEHLHSPLGYATPAEFAAAQRRPAALVSA